MKTLEDQARDATSGARPSDEQRKAERATTIALVISILASIGLVVAYVAGGNTQLLGIALAVALVAMGVALAVWGEKLLDAREVVEERHPVHSGPAGEQALRAAFTEEAGRDIKRRSFLFKLLGVAGGALGISLLPALASLGPSPGNSLKETAWRAGTRLVRQGTGEPLKADEIVYDQLVTVLPEGHEDAADSVALLIRVDPGMLRITGDALANTVNGIVCYSKICTHAGCPVGLYRAANKSLFCPCHQSQFNVLDDCKPTFGPAARPLPQLPIAQDADGFLYAKGDFAAPVGPAFWDRNKA